MPPKIKINKEVIIDAGLTIVRQKGVPALNARAVAQVLNCSTQPIFSNFRTIEDLHISILIAANAIYQQFCEDEITHSEYPRYKAQGMAYIRFAQKEKELFKLLFMRDRANEGEIRTLHDADFDSAAHALAERLGLTAAASRLMHLEIWATVHGIATMSATGFLNLDTATVSQMLTDIYQSLLIKYQGGN